MPPYPVSIPIKSYRGSNPRKREALVEEVRLARRLEKYLNDQMEASSESRITLMYGNIAVELEIPPDTISELLAGIGGHTGISIWKSISA